MVVLLSAGLQSHPNIVNLSGVGLDFVKRSANIGPLFHNLALQQYIILCSQVISYCIYFGLLFKWIMFCLLFLYFRISVINVAPL